MRNVFCIWGSYCHVLHPSTHKVSARSAHLELKSGSFFLRYIIALGDKKKLQLFSSSWKNSIFTTSNARRSKRRLNHSLFPRPRLNVTLILLICCIWRPDQTHDLVKKIAPLSRWKKNRIFFRYFKSHRDIKSDRYSTSRKGPTGVVSHDRNRREKIFRTLLRNVGLTTT